MKKPWLAKTLLVLVVSALLPGVAAAQEDLTPPALKSFIFAPTTVDVSAGAAEVTVTVRMTDELSGVQYGWATFFSSTWQRGDAYFPASTRISGDDHDGVYQATMTIPRYSEGGTWRLSGVGMYDSVGNTASYPGADLASRGFPTQLTVNGGRDLAPPVLTEFSFTPTSIDVSAGAAEVTVTVRMTDELSGVQYGWATFFSSTWQRGDAYFPASTRILGDDHDGVYQATMTIPRYSEGGTWRLSGVGMYDSVGNTASYPGADLASRGFLTELTVQPEPGDIVPPVLTEFSFTPTSIDVSAGAAEVTVTVRMTDELSGVQYGWATFFSSTWQRGDAYFPASTRILGDDHDGVYQATMTIPRYSEGGTWRLSGVGMYDSVGNTASYPGADLASRGFPTILTVNVNNAPVADAGLDRGALVGELLAFDGSASSDPDGSIASYAWAFGDGTTATGSAPTHSYSAAEAFTVTLTVTDDDGATATDTAIVTVQAPAGAVQSLSALLLSYNLKPSIATSLNGKLQNVATALAAANAGQRNDAANKLGAFINAVEAQRGKALTDAQADQLKALARRILAVLG